MQRMEKFLTMCNKYYTTYLYQHLPIYDHKCTNIIISDGTSWYVSMKI